MLEALLAALATVLSGQSLFFLILGVALGLVVGVIPGFGGTVGLSLLLPFVFGMEPVSGIAMMMGLMSVVATSESSFNWRSGFCISTSNSDGWFSFGKKRSGS